jgi:hypothetical protein
LDRGLGVPQSRSAMGGGEKILPPPGIELRHPARNLVTILTELSRMSIYGSHLFQNYRIFIISNCIQMKYEKHENSDSIRITVEVSNEDVSETGLKLRNRESSEESTITNETLKYGDNKLITEITEWIKQIFFTSQIIKEWKASIVIPTFKKGTKLVT